MYENFTRIPIEEQQRILQACLEEFAEKGYEGASTNAIVQRAGIPKGTLFYYFGSKQNLYLYVIDAAVAEYTRQALHELDDLPPDLFERLLKIGRRRMEFALREPVLYRLFFNAFLNTPDGLKSDLRQRFAGYAAQSQELIFGGLDLSRFKEGTQVAKVVQLISLVLEGLLNQHLPDLQKMDAGQSLELVDRLNTDVLGYFELIKRGVYR